MKKSKTKKPTLLQEALTLYNKGQTFIGKQATYPQAIPELEAAFKIYDKRNEPISIKNKKTCLLDLSLCYAYQKDFDKAIAHLQRYNDEFPNETAIFLQLASLSIEVKNFEEVRKHLLKLKTLKASNNSMLSIYQNLLETVSCSGEFNKAVPDINKLNEILKILLECGFVEGQFYYDSFLWRRMLAEDKFDDAYKSAFKYITNHNVLNRLNALYVCTIAQFSLHTSMTLTLGLANKYLTCCEEHKAELEDSVDLNNFANMLISVSKIYGGEFDVSYADHALELKYLLQARELGSAGACHDLGHIYHHGENCDVDLDKAILYYTEAVQKGFADSNLNLGIVLEMRGSAEDLILSLHYLQIAAAHDRTSLRALSMIGVHYFVEMFTLLFRCDQAAAVLSGKLAYEHFSLAYAKGDATAAENLGRLLSMGIGVEKNLEKALEYFDAALAGGAEDVLKFVEHVCYELIARENDVKVRARIIESMLTKYKIESHIDLKTYNLTRHKQSVALNKSIVHDATNLGLSYTSRIEELLKYNISVMNTVNVITILHKVGNLTDKVIHFRDFNLKVLPQIIPLLELAHQRLQDARIEDSYYVNLIEGVSKLGLSLEVESYAVLIKALYAKAAKDAVAGKLSAANMVIVLFAATRLDERLAIADDVGIIFRAIMKAPELLTDRDLANCIHAATLLSVSAFKLSTHQFSPLIEKANKLLASAKDIRLINQLCQALNWCHQNKIHRSCIEILAVERSSSLIRVPTQQTRMSRLQANVIFHLKKYFQDVKEEAWVGIYPVDALITTSDNKKIIIQVDGPAHFLHGKDTMRRNISTQFRDTYLAKIHPVISIPYDEWNELKTTDSVKAYLTKKMTATTKLPPEKPKVLRGIHGFFTTPKPVVVVKPEPKSLTSVLTT